MMEHFTEPQTHSTQSSTLNNTLDMLSKYDMLLLVASVKWKIMFDVSYCPLERLLMLWNGRSRNRQTQNFFISPKLNMKFSNTHLRLNHHRARRVCIDEYKQPTTAAMDKSSPLIFRNLPSTFASLWRKQIKYLSSVNKRILLAMFLKGVDKFLMCVA